MLSKPVCLYILKENKKREKHWLKKYYEYILSLEKILRLNCLHTPQIVFI
jgi:hypothetical protein